MKRKSWSLALTPLALLALVAFFSPRCVMGDDNQVDETSSTVPSPQPKARSGTILFKKFGHFMAAQAGIDLPPVKDDSQSENSGALVSSSVVTQGNEGNPSRTQASSAQEPTRSQMDNAMHSQNAAMHLDTIKQDKQALDMAKHTRIPKNAAESAEMDQQSRDKGFSGCWSWIHPLKPENLANMSTQDREVAQEFQKNAASGKKRDIMSPDEAMWFCRQQVMEAKYQLAKASGDPAQIKAVDTEYSEFSRQMDVASKNSPKKKK